MELLFGGVLLEQLARTEPAWADLQMLSSQTLVPWDGRADPAVLLGRHPLFEPWREQIIRTAALQAPLLFGHDPGERVTSRGGGQLAHLSSDEAPLCRLCGAPLTLCFQLQPELLAPWLRLEGALTAAYCFDCHPDHDRPWHCYRHGTDHDGTEACRITVEQPNHLVTFGEQREVAHELVAPLRRWSFPNGRSRALRASGAFATMLRTDLSLVQAEYRALVSERDGYRSPHLTEGGERPHPRELWRTMLGGYADWDQEDITPTCRDCEAVMKLVVDYNGQLFLDGALHLFTCTCGPRPSFRFVAEF